MKNIDLSLSQAEYKTLIELVYMGDWMANAIRTPGKEIKKYKRVEQLLYKLAAENDSGDLFEYAKKYQKYFPTRKFEESAVSELIQEYDDEQFWEELPSLLGMRDFSRKYGEQKTEAMNPHEFIEKSHPFLEKYWDEMEKYGVERLEIVERSEL